MILTGWGRYPVIEATPLAFQNEEALANVICETDSLIARGNGRSYGDSALASKFVPMLSRSRMLHFDDATGLLACEAGVLLSEIIATFLPRGWFPKVNPGTKLITVGGAIASDIHGKNHHVAGCFSECVENFTLMIGDGKILTCSRNENRELFLATCGGMGLTGIILAATISLKRVQSQTIEQTTIRNRNLRETFDAFEQYAAEPYSVAWIDCLAQGESRGRSWLTVGDFAKDGDLNYRPKKNLNVPFNFPSLTLNQWSVKAFNFVIYNKVSAGVSHQRVSMDSFFFPLDSIRNWNRIYGRNGFIQYQYILPKSCSFEGLERTLKKINESGMASFLAVLKLYGPANENYLSFPYEGYSLALDFKMQPGLLELIRELDQIVLEYDGRIYLTKDALVSKAHFEKGYPHIEKFRELRKSMNLHKKFRSLQSERLGL